MPHTKVSIRRRLTVRLMLFLSLALIPVGLLAFLQTREVVARIAEQNEARLADQTRAAAATEREKILWALGVADGLGRVLLSMRDDPARCHALTADFVSAHAGLLSVGLILPDGTIICSSDGRPHVTADPRLVADLVANPRPFVNYLERPPISKLPALISLAPVLAGGQVAGIAFVSQSHSQFEGVTDETGDVVFRTFNADGKVLTSSDSDLDDTDMLPANRTLASLATDMPAGVSFTSDSRSGVPRVYSINPIIEGTVYTIGIWSPAVGSAGLLGAAVSIPLFPLLMWVMSLIVAYISVDRLVLRHVRRLRVDMRRFARNRTLPAGHTPDMPAEIAEIFDTFQATSETIIRDEAELEQLIHDKNVLLKEVHHRVKNNLQLISSMMNMQMRKLRSSEATGALKRLQARVLSLATVHRTLYKTENLGAVQAGPLLEDLVGQLVDMAGPSRRTAIQTQFDTLQLYPDQAVPVSLLATEAVTNALKHAGNRTGEQGWLTVRLINEGQAMACLVVENSKGPVPVLNGDGLSSSGLGTNLIRAFASQLSAQAVVEETEDRYRLTCRFKVQGFQEDAAPPHPRDPDAEADDEEN